MLSSAGLMRKIPTTDLTPSPGKVEAYLPPGGIGVRVDGFLYPGYVVPPYYDSLVAKLIAPRQRPGGSNWAYEACLR